jgi:phosphate transport system substrate-binding protein
MKQSKIQLILLSLLILSLMLSACTNQSQPGEQSKAGNQSAQSAEPEQKGNITISGAWALYPMMTRWAEEYSKIHPKVTFDVSAGGAGKGMADALGGVVDVGMVSRDITPEEEAKGAYWVAVTKDAVFPAINSNNPYLQDLLQKGITQEKLVKIFITKEITTWGQVLDKPEITDQIHVYTRSDSCGAAETWAKFLGKKQEDLQGIGVYGDPGLLDAVIKDQLGIGFNNLGYLYDNTSGKPVPGAVALPIDANNDGKADDTERLDTKAKADEAILNNTYPSPPARAENLVTKGKPSGVVQSFITWILTDGQKFVGEAGYVLLPKEQLDASLEKVK